MLRQGGQPLLILILCVSGFLVLQNLTGIATAVLVIAIAMGIGFSLSEAADYVGLKLPDFVGALFAGILLTNLVPAVLNPHHGHREVPPGTDFGREPEPVHGHVADEPEALVHLCDAGPLMLLLAAQLVTITAWLVFVIFPLMGRTYDAAVMAGGYAGLGLGATPTAVANMTAVTRKCGPSPLAFLIVPLVGAFFIDIANAVILKAFIAWLR